MKNIPPGESINGAESTFTGDVYIDPIFPGEDRSRVRVDSVHFAPGSRTAWHSHAGGQILFVTEGVGLVQSGGSEIVLMRSSETVFTPPGEWHWHGATRNHFMTHLAIWETTGSDDEITWGELVREEEYDQQPGF